MSKTTFVRDATGLVKEFGATDVVLIATSMIWALTYMVTQYPWFYGYYPASDLSLALPLAAIPFAFLLFVYWGIGVIMPRSGSDYIWVSRILSPSAEFAWSMFYSLLGVKSLYSRYLWDESQSRFVESASELRYPSSVARPLEMIPEDFAKINKMTPSSERNASFDHAAYLLLFIASHLARYRPEKWKQIVDGLGGETSMVAYRRIMEHASELYQKMASAIFLAAALGTSPRDVLHAGSMREVESLFLMDRALKSA